MLDCAATSSAVLLETLDSINGKIFELPCKLSTFDKCESSSRDFANFKILPLDRSFTLEVENALVGTILTTERDRPPRNSKIENIPYMKDVHFEELDDDTIGVILDARFAWTWTRGRDCFNAIDDPIAIETKFGWTLIGPPIDPSPSGSVMEAEVCLLDVQGRSLQQEIRTMFRHDFIMSGHEIQPHEKIHPSAMDDFSLQQMENSIEFVETLGHYKVQPPWREGREEAAKTLGDVDSFANAHARLMKEIPKFRKDPARMEGTFKQIRETLGEGHARKVIERNLDGLPKWYMPIHIVTRPDKPGKFRICQDAASKVKGVHLNGQLCGGPDLLNSLVGVLMRFRRHKVAVSADIKNFFHMIHVADEDVAAFRFLFFKDESLREIDKIESLVHIFGASSSPPVANFTLRYHAHRIREKYGDEVFWQILLSFYVDDYISSFPSVEEAKEMRKKLTAALAEGGFCLTKWDSSHPEVLEDDEAPKESSEIPPLDTTIEESRVNSDSPLDVAKESCEEPYSPDLIDTLISQGKLPNDVASIEAALIDEDFSAETKQFLKPNNPAVTTDKVLGLGYDRANDTLFVRTSRKNKEKITTRRGILKAVASVFDPIGLAAPFVLKGKLFLQKANETNLDWNKDLPEDITEPFNEWWDSLEGLRNITIPRCTTIPEFIRPDRKVDLIVKCDASFEGYGVVVYKREYFEGCEKAHVSFVFAKAHVVPSAMHKGKVPNQEDHGDSMPRLELNAARLAAIIRDMIVQQSGEHYDRIFMFTDSATVLKWIYDLDKKFRTFENFRVRKIRLLTEVSDWRHIPSKQNPADICSHGLSAYDSDLPKWQFFLHGPHWLTMPEEFWPPVWPNEPQPITVNVAAISTLANVTPERLIAVNATTSQEQVPAQNESWILSLAAKHDLWSRKVKLVARSQKLFRTFLEFLKRKAQNQSLKDLKHDQTVTVSQYQTAETCLIRAIQLHHFEPEIATLLKMGVTNPNAYAELRSKVSRLTSLNPYLDEDLVLRVGGRLQNAETTPFDARYPRILPKDDCNVNALIRHEHFKVGHATVNHTFHAIRSKYFILGGRTTVSGVLRFCVACQKHDKAPRPQKEGDLPLERVTLVKPFRASGIDVFGPFGVKHGGRATHKRWVLLVTCLATRAVFLLPLKDMTTPTLINALIKFHNLFPGLEVVYSDNGTNFKGAEKDIKAAVKAWNNEQIQESLMLKGIEWKWGPPHCPHFGGVWERLVRSAKRHLKFILEKDDLNVDTLETALIQVSAILNSRPLTHASSDVNDMQVLCPANFLYPYTITHSSTTILPPIPTTGDFLRSAWRDVRRLADEFKQRWHKEYLQTLLPRTKWKKSTPRLYIGQIVLLVDEQPRDEWRIARVERYISTDETHGRRYMVKTADGKQFERHHQHLVPLELECEELERKAVAHTSM